ncbi:putative micro-fibrillar-associated protein [Rosa chinensis]|uniref:Putative micro-fibrillar-associated protein n=1 Tax=Rosa chinensis TaxID=74649 RepID=A0A2P6RDG9_ROSCH|nr:putative micro-fibrillar-associated protein [Rosa chinensis]
MAMRGKIRESTKVKRYWPGKAPEWANDRDTCSSDEEGITILYKSFSTRDDDPRLRRLAERRSVKRRIRGAKIVDTTEEEEEEEEEEDAETLEERRRRIKERLLRQREQEQQQEEFETDDYYSEDESDEDYEEEEEEEEDEIAGEVVTVKPVFLSKSTRDTIVERKRLEEAEEQALEARRRELEERKKETRRMVLEEIRKDEEIHKGKREGQAQEGEGSKGSSHFEGEKMNDQERKEYWERKNPPSPPAPQPRKGKLKFMQRDHHRGAFFRSDSDDEYGVLGRDYSAPTGEDKMDKTRLPKVMQVKNFGRRGRAKWTHLVNEDTTDWNSPWMWNDRQRSRYNVKMAAMNAPIARPKGNKRLRFSVEEDEL